jgi:hypothetical protein
MVHLNFQNVCVQLFIHCTVPVCVLRNVLAGAVPDNWHLQSLHVQRRLRINIDHDNRVCNKYWLLLDDRLQCGKCLRGQCRAASRVYVHHRLRFYIDDNNRVRR